MVGCGPVEPEGWEQQWRSWLGAPAATVFRWRSSGADVEMAASNAAQEAAEAAAAALVAKEVAEAAWAAAGAAAAVGGAAEAPSPHGAGLRACMVACLVQQGRAGPAAGALGACRKISDEIEGALGACPTISDEIEGPHRAAS